MDKNKQNATSVLEELEAFYAASEAALQAQPVSWRSLKRFMLRVRQPFKLNQCPGGA